MKFILKIAFLCIITQVVSETVTNEEYGLSLTQSVVLDFNNHTGTEFKVSPVEEKYEDWFFYYDNLTPSGLTSLSKEYFKDLNLKEVDSAGGVWVAFFTELGAPVFGVPFPVIELHQQYQVMDVVEITYYLHGTANITIRDDQNEVILKEEEATFVPKWKTFSLETGPLSGSIKLVLMPNAAGDFVLIDKVHAHRFQATTTTPTTESTSTISNTETMSSTSDATTPSTTTFEASTDGFTTTTKGSSSSSTETESTANTLIISTTETAVTDDTSGGSSKPRFSDIFLSSLVILKIVILNS